jgi:hypothetical protein
MPAQFLRRTADAWVPYFNDGPSIPVTAPTGNVWEGDPMAGLPAFPTVSYASLYQAGDKPDEALARLNQYAVVMFPDGFDEQFDDFSYANGIYGIFNQYLLGMGNASGPGQARIGIRPRSSTAASKVPPQGDPSVLTTNQLYLARIGVVGEGTAGMTPAQWRAKYIFGITIEGTDQAIDANSGGRPHNYGGFLNYITTNSIWQNIKVISGGYGHWGWQPGETFVFNEYKGTGNIYRRIEVDGRNRDGIKRSASPFGANNAKNLTLEDCYFHDTVASGLTFSFAGDVTNSGSATDTVTTRRVKVENNGNVTLTTGQTFTGFNHENVLGAVRHYNPDITMQNIGGLWAGNHMVFNNRLIDNQDIQIIEPTWRGAMFPAYNGAFVVSFGNTWGGQANKQVTPPKVVKGGVTLTPRHIYNNPGTAPISGLDPTREYVLVHGSI